MTDLTLERTPSTRAVLEEQLRVVGLAVRLELVAACALLAGTLATVVILLRFSAIRIWIDGELQGVAGLDPSGGLGLGGFAVGLALVAPLGIWKGEKVFGDSQLWSLPVSPRRHALIKVAAGWGWLMALLGVAMLSVLVIVPLGGRALGVEETRLLIVDAGRAADGDPGGLQAMTWITPWWQWVVPFTAATAAYLASSALVLATEHPWRWVAVAWLSLLGLAAIADVGNVEWLIQSYISVGFALDSLVTGGSETLHRGVNLASGEWVRGWTRLPTFQSWASATAIWIIVALTALVAAVSRRRQA